MKNIIKMVPQKLINKKGILNTFLACSVFMTGLNSISVRTYAGPRVNEVESMDVKEHSFRTTKIVKMISTLKPKFTVKKKFDVARNIQKIAKKYKLDPKLFVAIIDTESDFNKELVSSTGDLSMAQINTEIWNKEFKRMRMPLINEKRLVSDEQYSLDVMAKILTILKKRYGVKDSKWYARYHSGNSEYKNIYIAKVDQRISMIEGHSNLSY